MLRQAWPERPRALLRHHLPGPANLLREIAELGQAVLHRMHRLRIMEVDAGHEPHARQLGGRDVDGAERGMLDKGGAAAIAAGAAVAEAGLVIGAELVLALGDLDRVRGPEREAVDRTSRPGPAVVAMAIA